MTPERLAEIKARIERHRPTPETRAKLVSEHYADLAQLLGDDAPALLAEVERLRAELGETEHNHHIVDFRENGWTVQHPLSCRPNLFDCKVNKAAERDLTEPPAELGRFVCELDGDGRFAIGARAKAGGEPE